MKHVNALSKFAPRQATIVIEGDSKKCLKFNKGCTE